MAFAQVLAHLLASTEQAVGALFLDDTGETVDLACSGLTPYELQVAGAYLSIHLRRLAEFLPASTLGEPRLVHIERQGLHLHALPLPDGYCLVLAQRRPGPVARARVTLAEAGAELRRELF